MWGVVYDHCGKRASSDLTFSSNISTRAFSGVAFSL